jgi:hypothetical protein
MLAKISHDSGAAAASVEIMLTEPLPDYDLLEVEAPVPRDVDSMLASQGFKDLLDEVRSFLEAVLPGSELEIAQLTGAICHDQNLHRPGIWLVLRERSTLSTQPMSDAASLRTSEVTARLLKHLQLS